MRKQRPVVRGRVNKNISRRPTVTDEEARRIALKEMFQRDFNAEYHQILLRVSDGTKGLFWGSPPGKVT